MMKKLLLTIVFAISGIILLNAQCTPDTTCAKIVCPDTITNLPHAKAYALYSTFLTVRVLKDTTVPILGQVAIDSLNSDSISGLPTGITAKPNKSGWKGGTWGCVLISGTTTNAQAGTHNLTVLATIHTAIISQQMSEPGYKIVVDSSGAGISSFNSVNFEVEQNIPNPFSSNTLINFTSPNTGNCQFVVYNVIGDVVYRQSIEAKTGANTLQFSAANLPSGIYMYKLSNATQTITRRMIVEGK